MINFKTPLSKLVRHLLQSREKWKVRSLENQNKLRNSQINVRDLEASRNRWKERAKRAEEELSRTRKHSPEKQPEASTDDSSQNCIAVTYRDAPKWHSYPVSMIYMSICQVVQAHSGFRGGMRSLEIMSEVMGIKSPDYSSIRLWVYRLGLYLLQRPIEHRNDWIFIMDITVELGQVKCLLILGVHEQRFRQADFCLQLHDTEVLALEIFEKSTGEGVAECLEKLGARIGTPKQIVADQGSDIKKGIDIYQTNHAGVVYIPDLSHKIACIVRPLLHNDSVFQSFNAHCNQSKSAVQQTELNFLKAPTQRSKARYHHIAPRIEWAQKMLGYRQRGDFNLIDARYCVKSDLLKPTALPQRSWSLLKPIKGVIFDTIGEFDQSMKMVLSGNVYQQHRLELQHLASIGRQRFDEKFGWLMGYASDLEKYQQMVDVIECSETQLKHEGLHNESAQQLELQFEGMKLDEQAQTLQTHIISYIETHHRDAKPDKAKLVSSDVIESLFGQFKQVGHSGCLQELGKMVLLLPLLVSKITPDLVLQAMNTVKTSAVNDWGETVFGKSALALRNAAFSSNIAGIESA